MTILADHPHGLLWAYRFHAGGAETLFDAPAPTDLRDAGSWVWAHFPLSDQRARIYLQRFTEAPEDVRALLLGSECLPRILVSGDWTYGVLPDFERDLDGHGADTARLRFAFDARRFITVRKHALLVVDDMHRRLSGGQTAPGSPLDAFVALNRRYCEVAEDQIDTLAEALDSLEDMVLGGASADHTQLGALRRDLLRRHREISTLRTAYHRAVSRHTHLQGHPLGAQLPALAQLTEDVDREIVALQDRARLIHEEIDTLTASATNRVLRALTWMSALLMPPTLFVGAFGMNLHGIPFGDDTRGFALVAGLCAATALVAYVALRRALK